MWCFWYNTFNDTTNLFQLCHQVFFVLQTTSCINHQNINTFCNRTFHPIKYNTGWISFFWTCYDRNIYTAAPFSQLSYRTCTESIRSNQHNFLTSLFVTVCQFTNRGCFPYTINSYKEHDSQPILEINAFVVVAILFIELHQFFDDNTTKGFRFLGIFKLGFIT